MRPALVPILLKSKALRTIESRQIAMWGDSITLSQGASDYTTPQPAQAKTRPGLIDHTSGYIAYNGGVAGELASQIAARCLADTTHINWTSIFGLGRNSDFGSNAGRSSIIAYIQSCIDHIGHNGYVVSAILPRTDETDGSGGTTNTSTRQSLDLMNALLKASFPGVHNQVDAQIAAVCTDPGNVPPASLLSDGLLHYNDAGYALLSAVDKASLASLNAAFPRPADVVPDPFSFVALGGDTGVLPSSTATSAQFRVSGINTAAVISITGGTYSINGAAYTASAGTVVNGDYITVQCAASAGFLTTTTATLTIGGVSATFSVTTTASGELVVNGDMSNPASFGYSGTTLPSVTGGLAVWSATNFGNLRSFPGALVTGKRYRITYDMASRTSGGVAAKLFGGTVVNGASRTTNGHFIEFLTALAGNNELRMAGATANDSFTIDNLSLVQIN